MKASLQMSTEKDQSDIPDLLYDYVQLRLLWSAGGFDNTVSCVGSQPAGQASLKSRYSESNKPLVWYDPHQYSATGTLPNHPIESKTTGALLSHAKSATCMPQGSQLNLGGLWVPILEIYM